MNRDRLIDIALGILVASIFLGYSIYLAIMLSNAGGHW